MSSSEMLSAKEIEILAGLEKGQSVASIAEEFKMTRDEAQRVIDVAKEKRDRLQEMDKKMKRQIDIRAITGRLDVVQKGTMKVGSQILKQLSDGIYTTPAGSLKELVSNSYDSDATEVTMIIHEDEITIKDNGQGMDWEDFDSEFTFISRSKKRSKGQKTRLHERPIIGFIGIGFIAVSELCDVLTIRSGKADSEIFFEAKIDFSEYRTAGAVDKEFYEVSKYELVNLKKEDREIPKEACFTEIRMTKLRPGFKRIIRDKKPFGNRSIPIKELWERISAKEIGITSLGEYWQMLLELAHMTPVKYSPDGPAKGVAKDAVLRIQSDLERYNFNVTINGIELEKPMRFPNDREILQSEEYAVHTIHKTISTSDGVLSFRGYIYSQHGLIKPREYTGVSIRVKNVSIGGFDRSLLGYPSGTNQLFRNWICGEIYVDEGLEEALNINRSSFKITHPHYIALRNWLHSFLDRTVFRYMSSEYYYKGRKRRQEERKRHYSKALQTVIKSELGTDYELRFSISRKDEPVRIDKQRKVVVIYKRHPMFSETPRKFRNLLELMLLLFEISWEKSEGNVETLKKTYLTAIRKWPID